MSDCEGMDEARSRRWEKQEQSFSVLAFKSVELLTTAKDSALNSFEVTRVRISAFLTSALFSRLLYL